MSSTTANLFKSIKNTLKLEPISILKSSNFLNESNLIDQFALISDLFESVEEKPSLESISDRILNSFIASSDAQNSDISLKYFKLCLPYCSPKQAEKMLENYHRLLVETTSSHNLKLIDYLTSYLASLISSTRLNFEVSSIRKTADSVIRVALELLHSEERLFTKLAVSILERFSRIRTFRDDVLNESLKMISSSATVDSRDKKKRLECHVGMVELSLLTALADEIFRIESVSYLDKIEFWSLVQQGLVHTNPLTRRQALYLLKRANDFASSNTIDAERFRLKLTYQFSDQTVYLYRPDWPIWSDFFLCIELLEETSVHIIKPTLPKFHSIIEAVKSNRFHLTWFFVLMRRAFIHESKFITKWAISCFLHAQLHSVLISSFHPKDNLLSQLNNFVLNDLVLILQKSHLYKRAEDAPFIDRCPKIGLELSEFLNSYLKSFPDQKSKTSFLEEFTNEINNYQWNSICLLYVAKAIGDLEFEATGNLNTQIIRNIKHFLIKSTTILCGITTQEVYIRSATQTILTKFIIEHLDPNSLNLDCLKCTMDYLNSLSTKECLMYNNSTWKCVVSWLKKLCLLDSQHPKLIETYLKDQFDTFLSTSSSDFYSTLSGSNKIAKFILMLADCVTDDTKSRVTTAEECCRQTTELLIEKFTTCNKHVYASGEKMEKCIFIFHFMIYHWNNSKFINDFNRSSFRMLSTLIDATSQELIEFIIRKISRDDANCYNFESFLSYVDFLQNLLKFGSESSEFQTNVKSKLTSKINSYVLPAVINAIEDSTPNQSFSIEWKRFMLLTLFSAILQTNYNIDVLKKLNSESFLKSFLRIKVPTKSDYSKSAKDLPKVVSDFMAENFPIFSGRYYQTIWSINDFILSSYNNFGGNNETLLGLLLDKFKTLIEFSSPFYLAPYIKCSRHFVALINEKFPSKKPDLIEIFKSMYDQIWEMKNDVRNFNESLFEFLEVFYSTQNLIDDQDDSFKQFLVEVTSDTLKKGNEKLSAVRPLNEHFLKLISSIDSNENEYFIETLILFIIFGDVYKKEKKYIQDIETHIESMGADFGTNQLLNPEYLNDMSVRLKSIFYLLNTSNRLKGPLSPNYYIKVVDGLIKKDKELIGSSTKLYINSQLHRERFRIWQTLLTIYQHLPKNSIDILFDYCESNLVSETQPSIRFINEWLIIKVLKDYRLSELIDDDCCNGEKQINDDDDESNYLWKKMKNFTSNKTGYTISWLLILSNLVPLISNENKKIRYLKHLVPIILSQMLSSNFHLRTYVEAILIKLSSQVESSPSLAQNGDIKLLFKQINAIVRSPTDEKQRHASLMIKHFYFQFDTNEDYTVEMIYYWLPYLSGLVEDECLPVDCVLRCLKYDGNNNNKLNSIDQTDLKLKLSNENTKLKNCPIGMWKFTAFRDESLYEPTVSIEDLQKKIIPWHVLLPSRDDLEDTSESVRIRKSNNQGLILVASLVDKGTNLGGISRTCEIFNVKELVVASVRAMEEKEFQYLSVTSEKWLNIKEVAVKYLKTYLMEMKSCGYVLIGLEQTANSVQLHKFEFPQNSLLLLGNEKEGIPVELIQMLDYCVEIPQLGVIRSLNVHVSAAIAIWEFTKKHSLKNL